MKKLVAFWNKKNKTADELSLRKEGILR